jgi:hypothetical protein
MNADLEEALGFGYGREAEISMTVGNVNSLRRFEDCALLGTAVFGAMVPWAVGVGVKLYLSPACEPLPGLWSLCTANHHPVSGIAISFLWALSFLFPFHIILRDSSARRRSKLVSVLLGLSSGLGFGALVLAPCFFSGACKVAGAIRLLAATLTVGGIVFLGARIGLAAAEVLRFAETTAQEFTNNQ